MMTLNPVQTEKKTPPLNIHTQQIKKNTAAARFSNSGF